jgi:hypothetical protein
VSAKGDGSPVDLSAAGQRVFLVTLSITQIIEQESLDVSVFGSADGATWGAKSIVAFPQKFYTGESPLAARFDRACRREVRARSLGGGTLGTWY